MAKAKEKKVLFPSLMSKLGIGGSTSGLLSDITGGDGMSGVIPSLLNMGKTQGSEKEADIQQYKGKKQRSKLAIEPDSSIMRYVTEKGFFLDGQGKSYMQTGGKFYDAGEYDLDVHGLPVPLVKNRKKLQIA